MLLEEPVSKITDVIVVEPTERPGALSDMGRRVLDLRERGWRDERIGRHIGMDRSQIARLVTKPGAEPRHPAGELLVELHANVLSGCSKWTRILNALRIAGFTLHQIALRCNTSEAYLKELRTDSSIAPSHDLGERLIRMHDNYARR